MVDILGQHTCRTCKHYDPVGPSGMGECHLFPPTTQLFLIGMTEKGPEFHRAVVTQTTPEHYWCSSWTVKLTF
jgi:hypothetical protein